MMANHERDQDLKASPIDVVAQTAGTFGKYHQGPAPTIAELKETVAMAWAEEPETHEHV